MTTLVTALWQGLAVTWTTALVLKSLPRLSAAVRHAVWWMVLLIVLALPVWHMAREGQAIRVAPRTDTATPRAFTLPTPPAWLVGCLVLAWLGWFALSASRTVGSLAALRRLTRRSWPVDEALQQQLLMFKTARSSGRRPRLCQSRAVTTACATGLLGHPTIVVPTRLIEALPPADLDLIVMHEHAHLARYDDWSRLLQAVIAMSTGLHPAVALIGRRIDFEREAACDDLVVSRSGAPRHYARCLADAADLAATDRPRLLVHRLAPGATTSGHALVARVSRLVDRERTATMPVTRLGAAIYGLTAAIATCLALDAAPLIVVQRAEAGFPAVRRSVVVQPQMLQAATVTAVASAVWTAIAVRPLARTPRPEPTSRRARARSDRTANEAGGLALDSLTPFEPPAEGGTPRSPLAVVGVVPTESSEPPALPSRASWTLAPSGTGADTLGTPGGATASSRSTTPDFGWAVVGDRGAAIGQGVARVGVATGVGARSAGLALAGFFTRAGRSLGKSFPPSP